MLGQFGHLACGHSFVLVCGLLLVSDLMYAAVAAHEDWRAVKTLQPQRDRMLPEPLNALAQLDSEVTN